MDRKKEQIQERRESGKASFYRRGRADSVIRLGSNLFAGEAFSACVSSSHLPYFIGISELKRLCFYKKSSGYFYFFPASGGRDFNDGKLYNSGASGYGWSSTPDGGNAWHLDIWSTNAHMNNNNRGYGFPVRCVQASAPVFVFNKDTFVFFPASGYRRVSDGVLREPGVSGYGWSSSPNGGNIWYLHFWSAGVLMDSNVRGYGLPVRCVQASAAVFVFIIKDFKEIPVFFFPASGFRNYGDGSLLTSGTGGFGWTSTSFGGDVWYFECRSSDARLFAGPHGYGFPVRCVQASASVFVFPTKKFKWLRTYPDTVNDTPALFPAAGVRRYSDGVLYNGSVEGDGWTSTPVDSNGAYRFGFNSGIANMGNTNRTYGFPVRCVQGSAAVWAFRKENIKQIRYRRESGKGLLCRRGQADSVTRLGRKLSVGHSFLPCAAPSYLYTLVKLPVFECLYFYKYSSGYFLFFPASGDRHTSAGSLGNSGRWGDSWSSTTDGPNHALFLNFYSGHVIVNRDYRGFGFPVRCVQGSAAVWAFRKENIKQIRYRRESGKGILCRRGQADSVTRLRRKVFASENLFVCAASSYLFWFIKLPVFKGLYFYKHFSGYFLFFPASGYHNYVDGRLLGLGSSGYGWTSSSSGDNASSVALHSAGASMYNYVRNDGFSVRCVQASAAVFVLPAKSFKWFRAYTDTVNDTLAFFPASGNRRYDDGRLDHSGVRGYGWSSIPIGGNAWHLDFYFSYVSMGNHSRGYGFPVRCVQVSAAVWAVRKENIKQIRYRRESGKGILCRRGRADSVTRLGRKLSAGNTYLPDVAPSHVLTLIRILFLTRLYFYKHSSGYSLFFPASGRRYYIDGKLYNSGVSGYGWSSTPNGSNAWYLDVWSTGAHMDYNHNRGFGFPVRCVQASAAVWAVRKKEIKQIRYRRESGKASLCRRGQADSVTRLRRKVFASENLFVCVASSYLFSLIKLPVFKCLYFYKHSSGYFLFFPASGYRHFTDGKRGGSGALGYGWTSMPSGGNNAWYLDFFSSYARVNNYDRGHGFSVRCVQASAAVFIFNKDTFVFFPATGYREFSDGRYSYPGSWGLVWASTPSGSNAWSFTITSGRQYMNANNRGYGFTVRCVQGSATVWAVWKENIKQIRYRRESGKGILCRRGQADSVTRLRRKLSVGYSSWPYAALSYFFPLIKLPVFVCLYFYKHSSGYFLFFPATGFRFLDAKLYNVGTEGHGWTSTSTGSSAWHYGGSAGGGALAVHSHEFGFPVRCVQASAAVFVYVRKDIEDTFVFFPASGFRHGSLGFLGDSGLHAYGWMSMPDGGGAWILDAWSTNAQVRSTERVFGFSVRCVQASAAVFVFANDTFVFFPATGCRDYRIGSLLDSGLNGYGWSSTVSGDNACYLYFSVGAAYIGVYYRDYGRPVRCVQASAPVFAFILFPASGIRSRGDGNLADLGKRGLLWTATAGSGSAALVSVGSGGGSVYSDDCKYGLSVRCVQASATVFAFTKDTFVFFPASGYREYSDGSLRSLEVESTGWSSTSDGANPCRLLCGSGYASVYGVRRDYGFPVRCVQGSAAVWAVRKENIKQIRYRRESGKASLCRRGQADSVTRLGRKLSVGHSFLPCAALSYLFALIKLPVFECLYFYKHSSGYFLFFPASGYRHYSLGFLGDSSVHGFLWTSTPDGGSAWLLDICSTFTQERATTPEIGYSVRCVQASAAVWAVRKENVKQIRYRRESGKGILYRRGQADSVTRLGCKVFANEKLFVCAASSYLFALIKLPVFEYLYFCKHSSGYFLFFPVSGYRNYSDGNLGLLATNGCGWTSTPGGDNAWYLDFYSGNVRMLSRSRGNGFPVRCVQASTAVFAFTKDTFCFFPAAGYRHANAGSLSDSGAGGYEWTSVLGEDSFPWRLVFHSGIAAMGTLDRTYGFSVRCVQGSAAVFAFTKDTFVFFPASGDRQFSVGSLDGSGSFGFGWTSTPDGSSNAWNFYFFSARGFMGSNHRGYGFPVRCVQGSAAVWAVRKENTKQIRYRRESGKGLLCRRGQADSVTRLGHNLSVGHSFLPCAALSYLYTLVKLPVFECLYFYKYFSGYFLFFPATGYHDVNGGRVSESGGYGGGWSSTPNGGHAWNLSFRSGGACVDYNVRTFGRSVRCVQASAAVFDFRRKLLSLFREYPSRVNDTFVFFPASGFRHYNDGKLYYSGTHGFGWTSTPNGSSFAWSLDFLSGSVLVYSNFDFSNGFPVRCVQGSAAVWAVRKENIKQIRYRRESGKGLLCRRGQADSVTRLGRKLSVGHSFLPYAALSYFFPLIKLPVFDCLYFYKHSSGYFLFFPATGFHMYNSGVLSESGGYGGGWSSTPSGDSFAWNLSFRSGFACVDGNFASFGRSVRCVQASATVFVLASDTFVFFPATGCRDYRIGSLLDSGLNGYGWSSTVSGDNACYLYFSVGAAYIGVYYRDYGRPVRCVQASATVFVLANDTFVFFPAAGYRFSSSGSLVALGMRGYGWASDPYDSSRAWALFSGAEGVSMYYDSRAYGFSVRCVQASAAVLAFAKDTSVFFPAAGYRGNGDGKLGASGSEGDGWTSTVAGGEWVYHLRFLSGTAHVFGNHRTPGFPVRCVQASAAVFSCIENDLKQIRFRRESGKARLCRRGQADSVTRLGHKLSASENRFVCAVPSYSIPLIKLPVFDCLYFYKHSSGYFLFFPASGYRRYSDGILSASGTWGHGWTVSPSDGDNAWFFRSSSGVVHVYSNARGHGFPVRCVQASAAVFVFTKDTFFFFPASGYRDRIDGCRYLSGSWGYGWTSTVYDGELGWDLNLSSGRCRLNYDYRGNGLSVRCVQASATVFICMVLLLKTNAMKHNTS